MNLTQSRETQASLDAAGKLQVLAMALGGMALAYLLFKTWQVADQPGYDFKYLWTAGRMWLDGANPYQDHYASIAGSLIDEGHVPEIWAYPPNWWLPSTILGLFSLEAGGVVWNLLNVVMIFGASILLVRAFVTAFGGSPRLAVFWCQDRRGAWTLIFLHWLLLAVLEATAIVLSVGQTSCLIYFGVALTLYGLVKGRGIWTVTGLVVLFLKPQIGAVFGIALMLHGPKERRMVLLAAVLSLVLAIPAFIVEPKVLSTFLDNLARYDGVSPANASAETTGLRLLVWYVSGVSVGSFIALGVTVAIVLGGMAWHLRRGAEAGGPERAWRTVWLVSGVVLAMAPLHYYDYVLAGCLVFVLVFVRSWRALVAAIGGLLMLRADQLAVLTGLHPSESTIFEGSLLATIGALLICFSFIDAFRTLPAAGKPSTGI